MKKATLLKAIFGLTLVLMVSSAWGQVQPDNSTTILTSVASFHETLQSHNGAAGGGANDWDTYVDYVTKGGSYVLVTYNAGGATPAAAYTNAASAAYSFYVPIIVMPDPVFNPNVRSGDALDNSQLTDNSTWTWDPVVAAGGGDGDYVNVGDISSAASWTGGDGSNYVSTKFYQRYFDAGTAIDDYTIAVAESSIAADGNTILCSGSKSQITISAVTNPVAALDGATADVENCYSAANGTYNLVVDLSGTPPFFIGFDVTVDDGTTQTYYYMETLTAGTGAGADTYNNNGNAATSATDIVGTLADDGDGTWTYTIPISIDVDDNEALTNEILNDAGISAITNVTATVRFVNDVYSRKSDRRGTVGTPNATGELLSHVLFAANANTDLAIALYPTPATGNIFTLPN